MPVCVARELDPPDDTRWRYTSDLVAVTYVIDADAGIVIATATGPTATQEVADYQDRVRADPDFRPSYHQLFDFRASTPTDIFGAQIENLLNTSPFSARSRRAYVTSPGVVYGLARMVEAMGEQRFQVRAFEDMESAHAWLREA